MENGDIWTIVVVIIICVSQKNIVHFILLGNNKMIHYSPIYLYLIFAILQFEISSLMNLIFSLLQTWILQTTEGRKIQSKLTSLVWIWFRPGSLVQTRKKIQFIKLNIWNCRTAKIKYRYSPNFLKINGGFANFSFLMLELFSTMDD